MAVLKTGEVPPGTFARRVLLELLARVRRGVAVAFLPSVAICLLAPACQIIGGYRSFEAGDAAAPHPCDVLPSSSKLDAKQLTTLVLSKVPGGNCYWIDGTEVTVQEYARFLNEYPQPVNWDTDITPDCGWKTALSDPAEQATDPCAVSASSSEQDPFNSMKPITCVDWCDAKAFCHWAGKDLCGGNPNSGGIVDHHDVIDQWGYACSANEQPYPYDGLMPVSGACNIGLSEASGQCLALLQQPHCAPTSVGSFSQCTSPSGAVDMIGNVAEWVLSCGYSDGGPGTLCQVRGGSFADRLDTNCQSIPTNARATRDRGLGLRCCQGLTTAEQNMVKK